MARQANAGADKRGRVRYVRALYLYAPFLCNGEKIDFVYVIATMPGRHSGDQVHKVKKAAAAIVFIFYRVRRRPQLSPRGRVGVEHPARRSVSAHACVDKLGTCPAILAGVEHPAQRSVSAHARTPAGGPGTPAAAIGRAHTLRALLRKLW